MSALPLRLAILAAFAAVPVVLAACAGSASEAASSDDSALTSAADERVDGLILEAFATSTPTNFSLDVTSERSCLTSPTTAKVLKWNILGGQWFAPTLSAGLALKGVTEELTVVETPSTQNGLLDITFLGTKKNLDGMAPSMCTGDAGAASMVVIMTCRSVASSGMQTSITPELCSHGAPLSSPSL